MFFNGVITSNKVADNIDRVCVCVGIYLLFI